MRNFFTTICILLVMTSIATSVLAQKTIEESKKNNWHQQQGSACRVCDKCAYKGTKPRTRRYCYLDPKGVCPKAAKPCCYETYGSPSYYIPAYNQYYGWGYFGRRNGFAF